MFKSEFLMYISELLIKLSLLPAGRARKGFLENTTQASRSNSLHEDQDMWPKHINLLQLSHRQIGGGFHCPKSTLLPNMLKGTISDQICIFKQVSQTICWMHYSLNA